MIAVCQDCGTCWETSEETACSPDRRDRQCPRCSSGLPKTTACSSCGGTFDVGAYARTLPPVCVPCDSVALTMGPPGG